MWKNDKFKKVLFFATEAHKNQKMGWPLDTPYLAHIYGVTMYAVNGAIDDNVQIDFDFLVQVAMLHDVLEDTSVTFAELARPFGSKVAEAVQALTKNPNLPSEQQMPDSIQRIKQQPAEVWMVKLADRLFNLRERPQTWAREKQEMYKQEAYLILNELGGMSNTLYNQLYQAIEQY